VKTTCSLFKSFLLPALFVTVIQPSLLTNAIADSWNGSNDPTLMGAYELRFSALPLKGTLTAEKMPWSETFWPNKAGSINLRWNQAIPTGFNDRSPTATEAKSMTREELARLSPSEKYDLYMGRYDYPLKNEVKEIASTRAKWWAGVCDGWAPIALQYFEPKPVDAVNPDGISIPFGSSDIKGLMSYFAAKKAKFETQQVGLRCNPASRVFGRASCNDINAGALHVVLANQLGILKEGFVMERDPGPQIWNQPVYGYESQVIGSAKTSTRQASRAVLVRTTIFYADELDQSQWEPVTGTAAFKVGTLNTTYSLDLDSQGNIMGGEYQSSQRPDFVWKTTKKVVFDGYFDGLNRLYQAVAPSTQIQ
jgi:hypothetical protein